MVQDNDVTYQHPSLTSWCTTHPRVHVDFTPTSNSWLSLAERWFREITDKAIRRGAFPSAPDLFCAS
jgi:hypothetical protein